MMDKSQDSLHNISDISETLLLPLYARALESQSPHPILIDNKAVEITQTLNKAFEHSDSDLHKTLLKGQVRKRMGKKLNVTLSLRTRRFDHYCNDFLEKYPEGTIVELGCGLSTRFNRIDNNKVHWYDLDLPEVIQIREQFFKETDRYKFIRSSVLDFTWMDQLTPHNNPLLFIAEGLLMYLHEDDVQRLVLTLQQTFPGCELACEVANTYVVRTLKRKLWRKKFQRDFHLGKDATFHFGIAQSNDFEKWHQGIEFLDEWTFFDDHEKKLGWMQFFGRFEKMKKAQWIVHYKLY
jgi:methyltransferase (TIGR00027 family)